ncbi:MAG: carbohydrate kinase [Clostridia bacterium]|nr:carbohydrate kinase [Clostridia bacterium]
MIIGGLDVGTTGCKIALYDEQATLLDTYYQEYAATHQNGQHEINFCDIRNGVLGLLKQAVGTYRLDALGVTSFGETFAMLDENDEVLSSSMLYTDPRGSEECAALCEALGEENLTLLTGVKPHAMYSISKMMWHKAHNPDLFARCRRILLGEDFVVYTLTGNAQIDYSLAARTAAFDVEKKAYIPQVFEAAGIDMALMSRPVPAGTIAGEITPAVQALLGIDYTFTVVSACHDQVSAMIGAGVFDPAQAMDGTGTVECIPVLLEEKPRDLAFYAGGYAVVPFLGDRYACYALSFTGGATLKWFRDTFAEEEAARAAQNGENIYALLDSRVPTAPTDILVLPHFAGAATPYMDNDAKAAFVGVTLETDKYALYKALMEGTSYEMLLNFRTLRAFTQDIHEIRATGGGATSDVWLQIKADILDTAITALSCKEVGAAGTAAIAGLAVGAYTDLAATVAKMATVRKTFTPDPARRAIYAEQYEKYANLYTAVKNL